MQADKEFRKALSAILNQLRKEGKALTRTQKNMANTLRKSTKNVKTMVTPSKKKSPKKKTSKK
tara:strand:- start:31 stop:219 length:189 start_codon:yes stop_codon:yes gene_type:complete